MSTGALDSSAQTDIIVVPEPRLISDVRTTPDRIFRGFAAAAGFGTLAVLGLIVLFLVVQAKPAFEPGIGNFLKTQEWNFSGDEATFGVAALVYGTVVIATIALVLALPVAVGTALFTNEYAPRRLRRPLTTLIDLLAAIPSIIYGMWGVFFLVPRLVGVERFLSDHASFIPIFHNEQKLFGSSMFDAGVVLALMIVPIIATVSREVMSQTPRVLCEAALALGGSRIGMIRRVILPFSRGGIIGGAMLGLGRALGETIAIALILSTSFEISTQFTRPGGGSIAALIANQFPEAGELERHALVAAGLVLFAITLAVNMVARLVVNRSAKGSEFD